jgi:hypothetical protein
MSLQDMAAKARTLKSMKRKKSQKPEKVHKVMGEFKEGTLRSSSGQKVTNRKQAIVIAMSEAGLSKKKKKGKR